MDSIIYLMLILAFYLIPTWVAKPGRRGSVLIINLFFGWTFIGWVIALYMAVRSNETGKAGA